MPRVCGTSPRPLITRLCRAVAIGRSLVGIEVQVVEELELDRRGVVAVGVAARVRQRVRHAAAPAVRLALLELDVQPVVVVLADVRARVDVGDERRVEADDRRRSRRC